MPEDQKAVGSMLTALRGAADDKIMRIVSVLDDVADPSANQAFLDPLRGRLARLRPARPLRFNRLLFMPLDPIIVPARHWRPEQASIPRTILVALSQSVRAAPAFRVAAIEHYIAGCSTEDIGSITLAGGTLWPGAAAALAVAPMPQHWSETGLPAALYRPLADAVAAVLQRAPLLRQLQRDGEVGVLEPDAGVVGSLLVGLGDLSSDACTMIMRLILARAPLAGTLLRRLVARLPEPDERALLQRALARATGHMLDAMEHGSGFAKGIATGAAADVADHVRRTVSQLAVLPATDGSRGQVIRRRLDLACRTRFADELEQGLLAPIGLASGPVESASQDRLEACARDLRAIETVARQIGGATTYDALLQQAADAVATAAEAGMLSPMRHVRLIELLQGPEAAYALYRAHVPRVTA
nr:hypothetical protein [uncultured Lichenicoccus sp.]